MNEQVVYMSYTNSNSKNMNESIDQAILDLKASRNRHKVLTGELIEV